MTELRQPSLGQQLGAEFLGTAFLLAAIVGSGIMGTQLEGGTIALTLLANAFATGAILVVLIKIFAPVSGAHFNPAVSLAFRLKGGLTNHQLLWFVIAQVLGGCAGMLCAHAMFELPLMQTSLTVRTGIGKWVGEAVATFGLVFTILMTLRAARDFVAVAVGLYISAAIWFTASTSFANPAVTIARSFSDTFAGIQPADMFGFIIAQCIGSVLGVVAAHWFALERNATD